ncbi:MAG: lipid A deacylase LpxR family protein [Bdellovibrionaceae bacterium]|nr:lipid A deacylase LpxR family protein [Pseudobdellovibrionaceae bacterium]
MMNISVENDVGTIGGPGTDHDYTQGLKFSYTATIDKDPDWATLFTADTITQKNIGFGLSQKLFTPNGIDNSKLVENDRPYAGWLALETFYHFQNEHRSHLIALSVGIIGPEAGGENIQNAYHKATNYKLAEGWHHQLATEPTLELSYQQRLRFFEFNHTADNKVFDTMAIYGGDLGNVLIDGYIGAMIRYGLFLPHDLGPTRPSLLNGERFISADDANENSFYIYTFAAARMIGVGRNIFLDGNTFKSSHRVTKKSFVVENEVGLSANYKKMNLTWRFVTISPEFEERNEYHNFASISLSYLLN